MEAKLFVFAAVAISEVFSACAPSETRFENFQISPRRSIWFKIGVVSKKCPGLNEFYYDWKVQELPGHQTIKRSSHATLSIYGYSFPSSKCFVVDYLVTVRVSHFPDMSYSDGSERVFRFVPDQMHLELLGGSKKTHPLGEDLVMDAKTLSKDPSFPPKEDGLDENIIQWSVQPSIEGLNFPKKLLLTVPGRLLKNHFQYTFTITVTRTKIPKYFNVEVDTQTIEIMDGKIPLLNIFCARNCIYPHYMEITVFAVNCTKNCNGWNYEWSVDPPVNDPKHLDFGDGHDKLVILNNAYKEGQKVKVTVKSGKSIFAKVLKYAGGIIQGKCDSVPLEGISSVTRFQVNCTGFDSPYGIVLYNIFQETKRDYILINEDAYPELSEVYLAAERNGIIAIEVQDNAYLSAYAYINVTVDKYQPQDDLGIIAGIKQLVLATDSTSITSYSLEGFHNEAMQLIAALLDTIEDIKLDEPTARDLHKHMAEAILRMEPARHPNVLQRLLILEKLERKKFEYDTATSVLIIRAVTDCVYHLHQMRSHQHERKIPQTLVENFINLATYLSGRVLRQSQKIQKILDEPPPIHEYDSYDDYVERKVQKRDDFRRIVANVLVLLQTNCITALYRAIPDGRPKYYENELLIVQTERKTIADFKILYYTVTETHVTDSKVILPGEFLKELQTLNYFVDFQIGVFKYNPFWWHLNASMVRTEIILFDLFISCQKVEPPQSSFFILLKTGKIPMEVINGSLTDMNYAVYRVELEAHQNLVARFVTVPDDYEAYVVTWAECFCTDDDFDAIQSRIIDTNTTELLNKIEIWNEGDTSVSVFVCIKKLTAVVSYQMSLSTFSCVYWDITYREWSAGGCRVNLTNELTNDLICECHHLSLFAGMISIPPNALILPSDIDITIDFVKNYIMSLVVLGVIGLYIISLLLAHHRDQLMKKKNVVLKLDDNVPGDPHPYLVVVFTGIFFDASTTADVAFQLVGDEAKSRVHLIKCKGFKLLQRNTQDWFTLYCPFYLGKLKKIKIWHNSKGKLPHWYCERFIVQDLQTGDQYFFSVRKWFSLAWGSRKTYRIISSQESVSVGQLWLTHVERDTRDYSTWLSILLRDTQSNFTSKERVSVGFCFLFLTMLVSVLFAGTLRGTPSDSIDEKAKYFPDGAQVIIVVGAWMTATAVCFFAIFLFRNSPPL